MSRGAGLWIAVGGLVTLHLFLHLALGMGPEAPDLLTVGLLLAVREGGVGTGASLGFGFGLLEDAFSVLAFGANTVALTLVGALGARARDLFVGDSIFFVVAYLALGKWLRDLIHWVVVGEAIREPFFRAVLVQGGLAALYAAAVGLVVLILTGELRRVWA